MRSCNIRNTIKRDGCLSRIALFYLLMGAVSAFTIIPGREVSGFASNRLTTKSIIGLTASTEEETKTAPKLFDTNDKQFVEGAVVRVIAPLRAFQVNKKWYGSFDEESKEFVPADPDGERRTKCLVLPIGLRGVVTRVYDIEDLGPQHPIVVRFKPGVHTDEGFNPPTLFIMHFETYELEVVD
mmetsp:Transcript_4904/g.6639  ORF Transcript_4904/g.6639 Transcript_4904/m.6639 type:complete len:183 (-) Transcript_4904:206-754(-)